ncbi:hypothetical protein HAX54_037992 [Datura stramonium]|uniref:Uncharacterized protein n=1 Tax=Datura stramonium TaxID=4076 RepID=A0ABS8VKF3_DATST|nr:hypothetical protein [Datura stramonium]
MRAEIHRTQYLAKIAIAANTPPTNNRRPPAYFPPSDIPNPESFPISFVATTFLTALGTSKNLLHVDSSHQAPPSLYLNQVPAAIYSHHTTPILPNSPLIIPNVTTIPSQTAPPVRTFHAQGVPESYPPPAGQSEIDPYEEVEEYWRNKKERDR